MMARFLGLDELFAGRHFDREVIILCVRGVVAQTRPMVPGLGPE